MSKQQRTAITSNWKTPIFITKTSIQNTVGSLNPVLNHEQKLLENSIFFDVQTFKGVNNF